MLRKTFVGIVGFWIAVQLILVICFWSLKQNSDFGVYEKLATECWLSGEWYPMPKQVFSNYLFAPGFVNFLILQLKLLGTLHFNKLFNLMMNVGILCNVYFLAQRLFGERIAMLSAIIFSLLYSNYLIVLASGTEIPFLFLMLTALTCVVYGRKWSLYVTAGFLLALANWIRPLVMICVPFLIIAFYRYREIRMKSICLAISFGVAVILIGLFTKQKSGHFDFQSSTSGVNLAMVANDQSTGGYDMQVLSDSTSHVFIKNMDEYTYWQRDSIWRGRSIEWITNHKSRYMKSYMSQPFHLFGDDSWVDLVIRKPEPFWYNYQHGLYSTKELVGKLAMKFLKSMPYYFMFMLFLFALYVRRKDILTWKGSVLLIFLFGTLVTCCFPVMPRYHYPFLFPIIIWAASGADYLLSKYRNKYSKLSR